MWLPLLLLLRRRSSATLATLVLATPMRHASLMKTPTRLLPCEASCTSHHALNVIPTVSVLLWLFLGLWLGSSGC